MARKRASLKDKGRETLGLTEKKGKGIDVLFGGPAEEENPEADAPAEDSNTETVEQRQPLRVDASIDDPNDLSGLLEETEPPPVLASMPDSLPVNEADNDETGVITSEAMVDDLGLPIALDMPPSDLELATPMAEAAPIDTLPEIPAINTAPPPETLPPAMEGPPPESLSPAREAEPQRWPGNNEAELWGLDSADDFADMDEDELTGLPDDAATPATYPPSNLPPAAPSITAAPIPETPPTPVPIPPVASTYVPPSVRPEPTSYQPSSTYTAQPSSAAGPPSKLPSTATGAPNLSMPRAKIESVTTFAAESIRLSKEDMLPEDFQFEDENYILDVEQRKLVEKDEAKARKVIRYIGSDRREKLDLEIEELYQQVPQQLNDKPEEVANALKILRDAQDIVFEDARQYDEALYLVATVRTMLAYRKNVSRWSYTWGLFVFFYAFIWFLIFVAGLFIILVKTEQFTTMLGITSADTEVLKLALASALAGGIGGVSGTLYSLYWHVSHKTDFHPRMVMYYLVQPILGFILGAIIYFITAAGFLVVDFSTGRPAENSTLTSPVIIALQIALGWFAGFRQRVVLETVEKIMRRVLGRKAEDTEGEAEEEKVNKSQIQTNPAPITVETTEIVMPPPDGQ